MNKFRETPPKRTFAKAYVDYTSYKAPLAKDFNNRCGYTDCFDFWFGGVKSFHIDHFIPWKNYPKMPQLKTDYKNLVYCCSYVNILKSNDETNYLDPVDVDFNEHFTRDKNGNIAPVASSAAAKYMFSKLKLYMRRYQVIWMLDRIHIKMEELRKKIEAATDSKLKQELLIVNGELGMLMTEYLEYLKKNQ